MSNKQNAKTGKKKKRKLWKIILLSIALIIFVLAGVGTGIILAYIKSAPVINVDDFSKKLAQTSYIYDKDGKYVESLHGIEDRQYVPLSKINQYTQDAFIAIEDERFKDHSGIDIKRILGALWADLKSGKPDQGASTITQQLVKNTMLTPAKKLKRKIQEAYLAMQLEKQLSKSQILEYYLNTIYLGGPAYGVQAAAEHYFNKDADKLTLAESALIAGLTQNPSTYNPYSNEDTPDVYKNRQLTVLNQMLKNNFITREEYEQAKNEKLVFQKKDSSSDLKYQWFVESAVDSISADLKAKYNYTQDEIYKMVYTGGLKIYTTLDPKVQDIAEKVANDPKYYPTLRKDIATWGKDKVIQPQIGIVINDYKTGQIRAVVGGRGKQPLMSQNRATDTTYARQPGSAIKPIAVYGPAFDLGYSPASVIDDSPFNPDESALASGWPKEGPKDNDNKYRGYVTVREAVKQSLNVVAAKLMLKIGPDTSTEYIKKFGISTLVLTGKINDAGPAKALGGLTKGVTPLEMSAAYGVFGNDGTYVQPILYTKVLDSDGNVILEKTSEKHKVISPQAAYMTVDVMKDVIKSGTGTAVRTKGHFTSMPAAGKTGTTQLKADVYFAGLTPYYSGAIWMGHDKPTQSLPVTSSNPAWMWGDIMRQIHEGLEVKDFKNPGGIVTAAVCMDSGQLPTELCQRDPRGPRLVTDMFKEGTVPTESCTVHVTALVNKTTGKLASPSTPPDLTEERVFIKRPYPATSVVGDYKYQLPTEMDPESSTSPTPTPTPTPSVSPGTGTSPSPTPTEGAAQ
jgi:penicillin-binding protein 1A